MNVKELIEKLEEYEDDSEVRIMTQSSWPFENDVHGVACSSDMGNNEPDEPDLDPDEQPEIVYLVEGRQLGYGNKAAWEVARK